MKNLDQQILDDIIEGHLRPGQKLTVKGLCELYEVGPTPLREALFRLEKTELIKRHENRGFSIPSLSEEELRDIQQSFCEIECLALEKAIQSKDPKWESEVVASLYQLTKVESQKKVSYSDWMPFNEAFHFSLVKGCQSPCLLEIRNHLYLKLKRYTYLAFELKKEELKLNQEEHKQIAEYALEGKTTQALKALRHHLLDALEELLFFLKEKGAFE